VLSRIALETALDRPLGLGWGDFGSVVPPGILTVNPGYEDVIYPHNLPLEVVVEGGLVALLGLLLLAVAVTRAAVARATEPTVATSIALLVFAVVNAMFSSDLNGNAMVWVLAAAVLAAGRGTGRRPQGGGPGANRGRTGSTTGPLGAPSPGPAASGRVSVGPLSTAAAADRPPSAGPLPPAGPAPAAPDRVVPVR